MDNDSIGSAVSEESPPARLVFLDQLDVKWVGEYEREVGCVGERDGDRFAVVVRFFAADENVDVIFFDVRVVAGGFPGRYWFD